MASVTLAREFAKDLDVDGSLKNRAWDFLRKIMADPTAPGLHIEPIVGSRDPRVRTGRVNANFRAVMFLIRENPEQVYLLAAIKPHDEANSLAERAVLRTNPVNGVVEILDEATTQVPPRPEEAARVRPAEERTGPLVGFKASELEEVGIAPGIAAGAVAAGSEDELLSVLDGAPSWQSDVLLSLATSTSMEEALESVGVVPGEAAVPHEDIEVALGRPGSQMEFVRVESDEELRRVLEGPFEAWRTFLHPEQRRYVERDTYNGAFRLRGGAGTGKTVVALHRARFLAHRNPAAHVVLTTYTTTLAHSLRRSLNTLDPSLRIADRLGAAGIVVRGIDSLARDALRSVDPRVLETVDPDLLHAGPQDLTPLGDVEDRALWQEILDQVDGLPDELARPEFLRSEYRVVILGQDINSAAEYARAPRPGRGTRLGRLQRLAVWSLVETYRRRLKMSRSVSFPELAALSGRALDAHFELTGERLADHVVVDEAQDLNAGHWRLLRAIVAEGPNDLFICEDSHQRIYGEKLVLSRFGIAVRGRSRRLTLNYRTTAQNLGFAIGLLEGVDVTDLEGEPESTLGYRSAMTGPRPQLRACPTITAELDAVASTLQRWLSEGVEPYTIGVLTRSARTRDLVQRGLNDRGVRVHVVSGDESWEGPAPALLTMHRAKGLEFRKVVLVGIDDEQLPSRWALQDLPAHERADVTDRERFLLYVAATRARDELCVTWHGNPSGFLAAVTGSA
jgi:superfamily I DNA/RNA helicase